MGKSCTIMAHVRNAKGEVVVSKLFQDLLHYTSNNRELSKEYYAVGTNNEFLDRVKDSEEYKTDENGEITFQSLRSLSKMDLETDQLLQVLNKDIGEGVYPYDEAVKKIQYFNENSVFADTMLATMQPAGNGRYYVSVVPQVKTVTDTEGKEEEETSTVNEQKKLHDVIRNEELERKIKALLRSHGVSVRFLDENREGGRYSTENATRMEDGLYGLIEVNEKGNTTEVLAEEAGHFAVAALGDNPLVKRLESLLSDPNVQKQALSEGEYEDSQLGKNPAREVAGRLVGKALLRKLDNNAPFKVLANRIANLAKRAFYNFTGNEVRWATAKAEQAANKIAYQFVEGNNKFTVENALNIAETMQDARLTMNQKVYRDTIDELGRMCKKLTAIANDEFAGKMQASLGMSVISGTDTQTGENAMQMADARADVFAFDGIVQALVQLTDYLGPGKELDQMLSAVDLNNPSDFYNNMARNGRYLRQARAFLRSASVIINTIELALNKNNLGGTLVLGNGSTLSDVKYQDENGTWKSINFKKALTDYKKIIGENTSSLIALEQSYFARFCENIYGSKYITTSVGKLWNKMDGKNAGEQDISIEDMILGEGMDDIDIFHRYLGSMSNNPDIIGQIADKVVKSANKEADNIALEYRDRLIILGERAKKMGLKTSDLMEMDDNGKPTGNLITPPAAPTQYGNTEDDFIYDSYMAEYDYVPAINHGKWERAREEHKKEQWEKFKKNNPDWKSLSGFTRGLEWDKFYRKEYRKWNKSNSLKVEIKDAAGNVLYVKWVPNRIYESDAWNNLLEKYKDRSKDGDSLAQWVNDYRQIKRELDSKLPVGATVSHRLPQFKGTFMNSLRQQRAMQEKRGTGFKAWRKTFGRRVVLESFVETAEDEDYGDLHTMNSPEDEIVGSRLNYEEERALRLPIFGVNKLQNLQDLDSDLVGSMLAYASMAATYQCMDAVVDSLEVGKEALFNRKIRGKDTMIEKGSRWIGNKWRSATGEHELHEEGSKNRAYGRYLKYLDKQVYGISATHWGFPIGGGKRVLLDKLINNISSLGGTLFLKGNVLSGTVNTLTGFNNIFKEAMAGDDFDAKDWAAAHKYYWKHCPHMWIEAGSLHKNNRLSLFLEKMNTASTNREKFRNWKSKRSRGNNIWRALGYLPYSSGDHYMQAMSYLAVAHGTKLYDTDGTEKTNLWNAYKREKNTDEYNKYSSGRTLTFDRMCPLDPGEITTESLNNQGVFLKEMQNTRADFEEWLLEQDIRFADEIYKKDHAREYNDYRETYNNTSKKAVMKARSAKYNMLKEILQKTEDYLAAGSSSASAPVYTQEELDYLNMRKVGTGDYNNILQIVKNDIYDIIWTASDESAYMDKCREINNRLHGIYNRQDKTAWHQNWYTNAFLSMKGWALGYLEYMYSPNHYSATLGKNVEGFVNTAGKIHADFICRLFGLEGNHMGFVDMLITMAWPWARRSKKAMLKAGFSEEQNINARRMAMSAFLMAFLFVLRVVTAKGKGDDDDELDPLWGLMHYMAMRTLLEQEAFLYIPEAYTQSGQILDFVPVGGAALMDIYKLGEEGIGALTTDEDSEYYYHRSDKNDRYEANDTKFKHHLYRLIPYYKNVWAIQHPYKAAENYMFGRKLRTR